MKNVFPLIILSMAAHACSAPSSSGSQASKLAEALAREPTLFKFDNETGTGFGIAYPDAVKIKGRAKAENIFIELESCGTQDAENLARKMIGWHPTHPIPDLTEEIVASYHVRDTGFFQSLGFPDVLKMPCPGGTQTIPLQARMLLEQIPGPDYRVHLATREPELTEAGYFLSFPRSCSGLKSALNYNGRQTALGLPNIPKRRPTSEEMLGEIQLSCVVDDQPLDLNSDWKLYLGGELSGFKVLALRSGTTTLGIRSVDGVKPEAIDPMQLAQRLNVKLVRDPSFTIVSERRVALDLCLDPLAACNKLPREHKVLELQASVFLEFTPKSNSVREDITPYGDHNLTWTPSDTLSLSFEQCGSGSFHEFFRLQLMPDKSAGNLADPVQWMKNRQKTRDVSLTAKSLVVPCFQKAENTCQLEITQEKMDFDRDRLFSKDQCPSNASVVEFVVKGQVMLHGKTPLVLNGTEFGGSMKRYILRGEPGAQPESMLTQSPVCTGCQGDRALVEISRQVTLDIRDLKLMPGIPQTQGLNTIALSAVNGTISLRNVDIAGVKVEDQVIPEADRDGLNAQPADTLVTEPLLFSEALRLDQSTAYIFDSRLKAEYHAVRSLNSRFTVGSGPDQTRSLLEIQPGAGNIAVPEPNKTFGTIGMLGQSFAVLGTGTLKGLTIFFLNGRTTLDASATQLTADDRTDIASRIVHARKATTTPGDWPATFYGVDIKGFRTVCASERSVGGTQIIFDSPTLSMPGLADGELPMGSQLNSDTRICSIF